MWDSGLRGEPATAEMRINARLAAVTAVQTCVLPDAIGHGKSSKPSDSLRTNFPAYNYEGMVSAQHKLVTEGLGLRRVRLLLGFSMAGMNAWMWGVKTPGVHGRLGPNGLPAEGDVQSQLNDAASHYRQHPQRP